jgi:hypothetical protein
MAIRPADLQLAYLAAPQNAAQVNNSEQAAGNAQHAAAAAFASQVQNREETVAQTDHAEGARVTPDGQGNGGGYTPQERRHPQNPAEAAFDELAALPGDGEHFIDFTA